MQTAPIFIQGILQRSGTNFLWQLLLQHPDCHPGSVGEDFLLKNAGLLENYCKRLFENWIPEWRQRYGNSSDAILSGIGGSLISLIERPYYLYPDAHPDRTHEPDNKVSLTDKRLITKTPNVENLGLFFKLFPNAKLIIVLRDGRSVVESGMRSFGWTFEKAIRAWKKAAEIIIQFLESQKRFENQFIIVKYEDIVRNPVKEVQRILGFLGLDLERYNLELVDSLPVYGSSEIRNSQAAVHWKPLEKPAAFDPIRRWWQWNAKLHSRFNWIAGDAMSYFNYSLEMTSTHNLINTLSNLGQDTGYWIKIQTVKLWSGAQRIVKIVKLSLRR